MDLLLETEKLEWLVQHIDARNFARTCLYLTSCCAYLPEDDDSKVMQTAYQIYAKEKQYPDAMKVALMINDQVLPPIFLCFSLLDPTTNSVIRCWLLKLQNTASGFLEVECMLTSCAGACEEDLCVLRRSPHTEAAGLSLSAAR